MTHDALPAWKRQYDAAATEEDVYYCFRLLLGRSPNPEEWPGHAMQAGGALERIVAGYLSSLEFDRRHLLRRTDAPPPLHERPDFHIYASPDDPGSGDLIRRGVYEPPVEQLIRAHLRPGDACVDIGANVGYFSLLAAHLVGPAGHVFAVEANADNARLLEASRRANGFANLTVLQIAAGERSGMLALHTMHSTGSTSLLPDSPDWVLQARTVPSLRLDDLIPDDPPLRLIKIDIDGGEYPALRGAARLIATHRPVVITEFCPGMLTDISGVDAYGYLDWLREQGYRLAVISDTGAPDDADCDNGAILAALSRRGTDHLDLLARPRHAAPPAAAVTDRRPERATSPSAEAAALLAAANRHAADAEGRARAAEQDNALLRAERTCDAARIAALEAKVLELAAFRARAEEATAWLAAIRSSTSWRLTAPLASPAAGWRATRRVSAEALGSSKARQISFVRHDTLVCRSMFHLMVTDRPQDAALVLARKSRHVHCARHRRV